MQYAWTKHAQERAQKRFPGIDLDKAFESAKPITKNLRRKIKERNYHCRLSFLDSKNSRGASLLVSLDAGAAFVVKHDGQKMVIITVLKI